MKTNRNIYLNVIDIEDAKRIYFEKFGRLYIDQVEMVPVIKALHRVTAKPIFANISNPHYNASAMDGIAVNAEITSGAHERNAIQLKEGADFIYVDTGDFVSDAHNAVIMIEDVYPNDDGTVNIMKASYPWEHIRVIGEDIAVGDMILPSQHLITPVDLGALLSGGLTEIEVKKQLKIGIIPTGSEIVNPGGVLKPGDIIDSNSRVFEGMVVEAGGIPNRYDPVCDDRELLKEAILKAVEENDVVVINAGSSAGTEDYTVDLIKELGEVFVHGIAIKPGKPTILGQINSKAIIGIPGYPVSAYISFRAFVIPFISGSSHNVEKTTAKVVLSKRIISTFKHKEYVRMKIGIVGENLIGTPLKRGAGVTMSLVKADGILTIPKNCEGYEAGTQHTVELLRPLNTIKNALVSIGSHDIIMDHINDMMKKGEEGINLSSAHVGSLGGMMAIRKGETHIAPVHLLDENTGEYNVSYIRKYIPDKELYLLKGIKRWQGIYVAKGNPLGIKSIKDIIEKGYIFANRQRGSGTRTLLDHYLKTENIDSTSIKGYERTFTTHTNVALSVQSGNSHAGLGIKSVGTLMGLDFIPLSLEDYDFIIPHEHLESPLVNSFTSVIKSEQFTSCLKELGGYECQSFELIKVGGEKKC